MLDRETAIATIRGAYDARLRGDKQALARFWADDAHFEVIGDQALFATVPLSAPQPMEAISVLIDRFQFSDLVMRQAIVDGDSVAVHWSVTVTVAGKPPAPTQLLDVIRFNADGKVRSLVQFADTALIRHLAG